MDLMVFARRASNSTVAVVVVAYFLLWRQPFPRNTRREELRKAPNALENLLKNC